jgi:hypothetical protein
MVTHKLREVWEGVLQVQGFTQDMQLPQGNSGICSKIEVESDYAFEV